VQPGLHRGIRPSFANDLTGVSCTSQKACTAVGRVFGKSLVERWNGSQWRLLQSTPQLALTAVSCTSATACTAVGSGANTAEAESINGTRQSIVPMSDPGGEPNSASFPGLACPSPKACMAVGFYYPSSSGDTAPLVERLSHGNWSLSVVGPAEASGRLSGVSCPARRRCAAAGELSTAATSTTWVVHWNGSVFSTQNTPNGAMPASVLLSAVSCASSIACTAVGQFTDRAGVHRTLAEAWRGAGWSIQTTPNPRGGLDSQLSGVSCPTTTMCIAVGDGANGQLIERWDGTSWKIQRTPNLAGASLEGVSCTAASACTAVGSANHGPTRTLLAEGWDGTTWTAQRVPDPTTGQNQLNAVSCTSPTACTAVGAFTNADPAALTSRPLAETWNGATWTIQTAPSPAAGGPFAAVSCATGSTCTAVGYANGSVTTALAESWDGASWSVESVLSPTFGAVLGGVSCTSVSDCVAVGTSGGYPAGPRLQLAVVWDGATWNAENLPTSAGGTFGSLSAVSCTLSTACIAVGSGGQGMSGPIAVRSS
jgi:hypothetical protein